MRLEWSQCDKSVGYVKVMMLISDQKTPNEKRNKSEVAGGSTFRECENSLLSFSIMGTIDACLQVLSTLEGGLARGLEEGRGDIGARRASDAREDRVAGLQ